MKYTVRLSRTEVATVVVDTDEYPEETANWPNLDTEELRVEVIAAAWEMVRPTDWDEDDSYSEVIDR